MSNEQNTTFWEHIQELRTTLLKMIIIILLGTTIAACFYPYLFTLIKTPLDTLHGTPKLVILKPTEGIVIALKVSFWTGLITTSPLWLFQFLLFFLPALKSEEKRGIFPLFVALLLFFFIGVTFSYQVTIPLANHYLLLFNENLGVNMWTLGNYIDYTFVLLLGNGLAFEVMVILFFLVHFQWVTQKQLREKRKYFILGAFVFSALITPPDVITQLLLAIPLSLLYEIAILYSYTIDNKRSHLLTKKD